MMMINSLTGKRECVEEILKWVGTVSDFDIMAMAEQIRNGKYSFSGSLSKYELSSCLREAISVYLEGEFDAAFVKLKKLMLLMSQFYTHDSTPKGIREFADMLKGVAENVEMCDFFLDEWKRESEREVKYSFKADMKKFYLNAYDCLSIKKSIDSRHFHLYKYKSAGEVTKTTKYKLSNGIVASDTLSNLITNTGLDDTWGITVGLYLEKKIDLSYFVITFSLNGNVFVLTDKFIYQNPDQLRRVSNRGGGRRFSEDRERNLDFLPYILIDKVIENRKNSKDIARQAGNEIWTFPLEEYFCENLFYVIKYTIEKILSDYSVKCLVGADSNMLLLTEGKVDMNDDSHFLHTNIDELNEIVKEIYGETSTSLVVPNKQLIEQLGFSTELMTVENVESDTQYLAHKLVVENHEKEKMSVSVVENGDYHDTYKEYAKQKGELFDILKSNAGNLEKFLFAGKKVYLHDIDHPVLWNGFNAKKNFRHEKLFVTKQTNFSILNIYRGDAYCLENCNRVVKNNEYYRSFDFLRYTEIATLLGIGRKGLPPMFRDYIAHYYLPYSGNCILDNVKPEFVALEQDFVSNRNPNGFLVTFPYCGICSRKLYKKHMVDEEAYIVISSKQNRVIGIYTKNEFLKTYAEK